MIGDFNGWDSIRHPMRLLGESGVWELFIPDVGEGSRYKYEIRGSDDVVRSKADPMAQATEHPGDGIGRHARSSSGGTTPGCSGGAPRTRTPGR